MVCTICWATRDKWKPWLESIARLTCHLSHLGEREELITTGRPGSGGLFVGGRATLTARQPIRPPSCASPSHSLACIEDVRHVLPHTGKFRPRTNGRSTCYEDNKRTMPGTERSCILEEKERERGMRNTISSHASRERSGERSGEL